MGTDVEAGEHKPPTYIEDVPVATGMASTHGEKYGAVRALIEADLLDERYSQTKRGLSNRQVQMM